MGSDSWPLGWLSIWGFDHQAFSCEALSDFVACGSDSESSTLGFDVAGSTAEPLPSMI